jgi:hypothetical protein
MNKKTIIKFLQSFVAIPILAVSTPLIGITPVTNPVVLSSQNSTIKSSVITTQEDQIVEKRAEEIDAFLSKYNSPLKGYGKKFVQEADKNNIDWRLLVAISGRESTFGIHSCINHVENSFGYGSCSIHFKSIDDAIESISASLGGNDKSTEYYYKGKNTIQILRTYNSVIPNYPKEVVQIMKMIDSKQESI